MNLCRVRIKTGLVALALIAGFGTASPTTSLAAVDDVSTNVGLLPDGEQALQLGDYSRAETIFTNALKRAPRNSAAEFYARLGLAESHLWQGEIPDATKELKRAESVKDSVGGNPSLLSRLYEAQSWISQAQGNLQKAYDESQKALSMRLHQGHAAGFHRISNLIHTAHLADLLGQSDTAIELYKKALDSMPSGSAMLAADAQQRLASVLWRTGQADEAQKYFQSGLEAQLKSNAVLTPYSPHPYWQDVIFRFQPGAPNTSKRTSPAGEQEMIWANGVTVVVTTPVKSTEGKFQKIGVAIKNDTNQPIQFLPTAPIFFVLQPKPGSAKMIDPQTIANTVEKKGERKAKWIRFWGKDASQSVTTTMVNTPGYWGGYMMPPMVAYPGTVPPIINQTGNISTITQQVPDYAAQARALQRAADAIDNARESAATIRANTLGPTTVRPGEVKKGELYFDVDKVTRSFVWIPIGNAEFQFEFPPRS